MVDYAQAVPAADRDKKQAVVNTEPHFSKLKYVETFMAFLLTDEVTSSYNLGLAVCPIEQSMYNCEHIGADNENTRRFGHNLLRK